MNDHRLRLLRLPPAAPPRLDLAAVRARLASADGPQYLAQPGSGGGDARVQRVAAPGVSRRGGRVDRRAEPAAVSEDHGGVVRAGGSDGLHAPAHREDPALRQAARGTCPGHPAAIRHGDDAGRVRDGPARREPRGPPDQDRGQPGPPDEPGRGERVPSGVDLGAVRSRPHAHRAAGRGDEFSWEEFLADLVPALAEQAPKAARVCAF